LLRLSIALLLLLAAALPGCGGDSGDSVDEQFLSQYPAQVTPALQAVLREKADDELVPVIVQLADSLDSARFSARFVASRGAGDKQAQLRSGLVRALQDTGLENRVAIIEFFSEFGVNLRDLWAINGVAGELPVGSVDELAEFPGVEEIDLDQGFELPESFNLPPDAAWGVAAIEAPEVWNRGSRGQGVTVAILDTGVDFAHVDLRTRWRGGGNSWFDPHGEYAQPHDNDGHGTQVAGIAVGGDASGQPIGVAPEANWIAAKLFDSRGHTRLSAIHAALQWLLDPDGNPASDDAPQVVNNSWGLLDFVGACNDEFRADIANLRAANISVVFAAGNSGPYTASDISPANESGSFSVGAVRPDGLIDASSSRGPNSCDGGIFPRVVAPGVAITTSDLTYSGLLPNTYSQVSGSSFAAPHAAGAIALLRAAMPAVSAADIDAALEGSAIDLAVAGPDHDSGYGLINLPAAWAELRKLSAGQ
jgi:bacillopeptidase F